MLLALASIITLVVGFTIFAVISDLKNKSDIKEGSKDNAPGNVESISRVPEPKRENVITAVKFEPLNIDRKKEKSIQKSEKGRLL